MKFGFFGVGTTPLYYTCREEALRALTQLNGYETGLDRDHRSKFVAHTPEASIVAITARLELIESLWAEFRYESRKVSLGNSWIILSRDPAQPQLHAALGILRGNTYLGGRFSHWHMDLINLHLLQHLPQPEQPKLFLKGWNGAGSYLNKHYRTVDLWKAVNHLYSEGISPDWVEWEHTAWSPYLLAWSDIMDSSLGDGIYLVNIAGARVPRLRVCTLRMLMIGEGYS